MTKTHKRHAGIRPDLEIRHAADLFNRLAFYLADSQDPRLDLWAFIYAGRLSQSKHASISRRAAELNCSRDRLNRAIRRCKSLVFNT